MNKLKQIRALLNTARQDPDGHEGIAARRIAMKKLERLGMTEEDVELEEKILLHKDRSAWEAALLHLVTMMIDVDLVQNIDLDTETNDLKIRGSTIEVVRAEYQFQNIRNKLFREGEIYQRSIRWAVSMQHLPGILDVFYTYAVIALSERTVRREEPRQQETDQEETHQEESTPEEEKKEDPFDPLDDLMNSILDDENKQTPKGLDPAIAGYRTGFRLFIADGLEGPPELNRRAISRTAGLLTEDETRELNLDPPWLEDL